MSVIPKKSIKKSTAYHEAGHAVARWAQGMGMREVTIIPDEKEGSLGHVNPHRIPKRVRDNLEFSYSLAAEGRARKEIIVLFTGYEAQRLVSLKISRFSWSADRKGIDDLLCHFVSDSYSTQKLYLLWWKLLHAQAQKLVTNHKDLISALAEHLLKCERMSGCEVREFFLRETDPQREL